MATLQGLIANKMLVDSIFALPDLIPYWIKCIAFFFVTLPVNMFTLFDDALGAFKCIKDLVCIKIFLIWVSLEEKLLGICFRCIWHYL